MAKVHKNPWKVHPNVSVSGGKLHHGLGQWLNQQLKPIVKMLPSYISRSSFNWKQHITLLFSYPRVTIGLPLTMDMALESY
jgi:hypothetical protein